MRILLLCLTIALGTSACGIKDDPVPVGETVE